MTVVPRKPIMQFLFTLWSFSMLALPICGCELHIKLSRGRCNLYGKLYRKLKGVCKRPTQHTMEVKYRSYHYQGCPQFPPLKKGETMIGPWTQPCMWFLNMDTQLSKWWHSGFLLPHGTKEIASGLAQLQDMLLINAHNDSIGSFSNYAGCIFCCLDF